MCINQNANVECKSIYCLEFVFDFNVHDSPENCTGSLDILDSDSKIVPMWSIMYGFAFKRRLNVNCHSQHGNDNENRQNNYNDDYN